MSKLAKRVLICILSLSFVLLSVPFSINASTTIPELVGINIVDEYYDAEITTWRESSHSCTITNNTQATATINCPQVTYTGNSYEYKNHYIEFVFNDWYVGYVHINGWNNSSQQTPFDTTFYVNGFTYKLLDNNNHYNIIDIVDYDLSISGLSIELKNKNIPIENYALYGYFLNAGSSFDNNSSYYLFNQSYPVLSGYDNYSSYQSTNYFAYPYVGKNIYIFMFLDDTNRTVSLLYNNAVDNLVSYIYRLNDNTTIVGYTFDNRFSGKRVNFKFSPNADKFIPLYAGNINLCPTELLLLLNINNDLDNTSDDIDQTNNEFNQTITDFDDLEQNLTDDFNDNLDDIDFTVNPSTHFGSNFINATSWVTTQFNNLITSNPFGDILTFSLTLGIALLLIGRIL